jgi:hypothetical protein
MDTWDSSTWWGLIVFLLVLLAIPLLTRQATDQLLDEKNPHLPNGLERAKTDRLSWLWIVALGVVLLLWSLYG